MSGKKWHAHAARTARHGRYEHQICRGRRETGRLTAGNGHGVDGRRARRGRTAAAAWTDGRRALFFATAATGSLRGRRALFFAGGRGEGEPRAAAQRGRAGACGSAARRERAGACGGVAREGGRAAALGCDEREREGALRPG
jgi:hypothetical protein